MPKRIAALFLVVGALVAIYLNPLKPVFSAGETSSALQVETKARDLSIVCPGALFRAGGSSGTSLDLARTGEATSIGYFDETTGLTLVEQRVVPDAPLVQGTPRARFVEAKGLTVLDPEGKAKQSSALLSALQFQVASVSNMSGLAAANCMRPTSDAWLVGGDTTSGRESLLILVNPSNVDSKVDLELYGPGGKIVASGLTSISAPKQRTTVIPLSSLTPSLPTFSVHVESSGGALGVWMQIRAVRGLAAGGVELIAPAIDASKLQTVPGVFIRGTADGAKLVAVNPAYSDTAPVLRVQNTSTKQATVTAQLLGTTATTYGTVVQEVVPPNATIDIPITDLADGDYAAFIDSSEPVRAAIRLNRTKGGATDVAWLPAVQAISEKAVTSAPSGSITKLSIVNPGKVAANVTFGGKTLKVPGQSSISTVMTSGVSWSITSDQPVAVSTVIDFSGAFSVVPVIDFSNLGGQLNIWVR